MKALNCIQNVEAAGYYRIDIKVNKYYNCTPLIHTIFKLVQFQVSSRNVHDRANTGEFSNH